MRFIFFNDTATTEIYTLSRHDALPIYSRARRGRGPLQRDAEVGLDCPRQRNHPREEIGGRRRRAVSRRGLYRVRTEEHTSELQSRQYLVCRLLLGKKHNSIVTQSPTSY